MTARGSLDVDALGTVGPYRLEALLGHGGMGVVHRARHRESGEVVALKLVASASAAQVPRIRREIEALARLRHPGIVHVRDSGLHAGMPWYAMEVLEGGSLQALVRCAASTRSGQSGEHPTRATVAPPSARCAADDSRGTPDALALGDVLTLARRLCAPLAYLHGEALVHRDLTPGNVLLRANGQPVLIDFGLLTEISGRDGRELLLDDPSAAGTLAYVAPEQLRGDALDARADLYSLGCVLYALLTGAPPFAAPTPSALLAAHLHDAPAPPSRHRPELPAALDELVLRLLAKHPRERPGHATDVAAALAAMGAAEGPPAPRPRAYLYRPGFVGRDDALAALRSARRDDGTGPARVCLLGGESGVGKTRLASEFARLRATEGVRVLTGECTPFSADAGPAGGGGLGGLRRPLQALADLCREGGRERTERWLGSHGPVLAPYAPALRDLPGQATRDEPVALPGDGARARLFHALSEVWSALAAEHALLLVLDDLQWADDLTLGFLRFVAAAEPAPRGAFRVLATFRSEERAGALSALVDDPAVARVSVGRLDDAAVGAIVADMLALAAPPVELVERLVRDAEGMPFFVAEYLRAAVSEGLLRRDARGRWQLATDDADDVTLFADRVPLPCSLRALVERRLDALGPAARHLALAAAVLGREVDPAQLERLATDGVGAGSPAFDELLARQVLERAGPRLRFVHDKIREVAYEAGDEAARAALHRAVADDLERAGGADPAALAHHWRAGLAPGRAAPHLLAVGDRGLACFDHAAAQRAYTEALAVLTDPATEAAAARALAGAPPVGPVPPVDDEASRLRVARRRAHEGRGDASAVTGRNDEALADYGAAMALCKHARERAALLGKTADAWFAKGALPRAAHTLERALALLELRLPVGRAAVLAAAAWQGARLLLGRTPPPLVDQDERARARLRLKLLNRLVHVTYSFDMERTAQRHLLALASAERVPDAPEAAMTFAHHGPVFAGLAPARARRFARRAVRVCEREGHLAVQMHAEFLAGVTLLFQARWGEARAHLLRAIELYPQVGDVATLEMAHENAAFMATQQGEVVTAMEHGERALRLSRRVGDARGVVSSLRHLALASLQRGDAARAEAVIAEAQAALAGLDDHVVHSMVHCVRGQVALARGRRADAEDALREAVRIADVHRLTQPEVLPAYGELAELRAADGALSEAAALTRAALRGARRAPACRAGALRAEALLCRARGRRDRARALLRESLSAANALQLHHEAGRTRAALAAIE